MDTICPIDRKCASQISVLLHPPPPPQVQEYFEELISSRQCRGFKVKQNGEFGKGVYADLDFKEGELILKDPILVGIQHPSNKIDCLVCSLCFQFIGSIELQIGRKLYLQSLGVSANEVCDNEGSSKDFCDTNSADEEDDCYVKECKKLGNCASSSSSNGKVTLPEALVQSLMNGELVLPHSKTFCLPSAIACPGGCGEAYYCSKKCAEADWKSSHSLLCTGKRSEALSREALAKFIQHANDTNDIFLLAAKAISFTILRYRKLKAAHLKGQNKHTDPVELDCPELSLLLEAWKPLSIGYKRKWWECISLPDDVDCSDETAFRMEIRDLAFTSLQLLKAAIFDQECEPLFSLEIYGNIIGMFELNNLDLVVASPVEDYFLYIDALPYSEKRTAEEITQSLLDALGDGYSVCCQGTAFYPLQSCMNHSCCPNARAFKREQDKDGQATIVALRSISEGEEITISYIEEDLPFEERQALLADYGFRCRCAKCIEEETT